MSFIEKISYLHFNLYIHNIHYSIPDPRNLKMHVKTVHEGIKEFGCDLCSQVFGHKGHMKDHMKNIHGTKDLPCENCGKLFALKKDLNLHMRRVHGMMKQRYKCKLRSIFSVQACIQCVNTCHSL